MPLVTVHLRGSRPGDPRFLLLGLFSICFLFYYYTTHSKPFIVQIFFQYYRPFFRVYASCIVQY